MCGNLLICLLSACQLRTITEQNLFSSLGLCTENNHGRLKKKKKKSKKKQTNQPQLSETIRENSMRMRREDVAKMPKSS